MQTLHSRVLKTGKKLRHVLLEGAGAGGQSGREDAREAPGGAGAALSTEASEFIPSISTRPYLAPLADRLLE